MNVGERKHLKKNEKNLNSKEINEEKEIKGNLRGEMKHQEKKEEKGNIKIRNEEKGIIINEEE